MNGASNVLVDTNLIILGVGGDRQVRHLLEDKTLFISVVTEIELLSIPFQNSTDEKLMKHFISNCFIIDLDTEVKNETVLLRKKSRIKLPDAIIAASSIAKRLPLFTADKGFSRVAGLNVIIY